MNRKHKKIQGKLGLKLTLKLEKPVLKGLCNAICHHFSLCLSKTREPWIQKPPSQLHFSPPSTIITITSNEPWNTETHKTDQNPPITNHKPRPFETIEENFCFLRGPLRRLTAAKNAHVSWLLNFRIHVFLKSAVQAKTCLQINWLPWIMVHFCYLKLYIILCIETVSCYLLLLIKKWTWIETWKSWDNFFKFKCYIFPQKSPIKIIMVSVPWWNLFHILFITTVDSR